MALRSKETHKGAKRCWEFFHCDPEKHKHCLIGETQGYRCWLVNIPCCRMPSEVPRPISVKKVICKSCDYYKAFKDP